jgi:hypothetical protein
MTALFFIYSWAPVVVLSALFFAAIAAQVWGSEKKAVYFRRLIIVAIFARLAYATLSAYLQYYVWSASPFTQLLLPPHAPWSYFLQYIFTHYLLNALLSISAAALFWLVFEMLRRYRLGVINREEPLAALLAALVVGWPGFIIFVPIAFLFAVLSIALAALYSTAHPSLEAKLPKKPTFEWPLLLAIIPALFFAKPILIWLHLTALLA